VFFEPWVRLRVQAGVRPEIFVQKISTPNIVSIIGRRAERDVQLKSRSVIAVVDDDMPMRAAFSRLLRAAGFDVSTFASGAAFLESLKSKKPDCVVLDVQMPEMDGCTVLERLREAGIRIPIIIVTAGDSAETRERALAGGVAAYFNKPVSSQTLINAINAAIAAVS